MERRWAGTVTSARKKNGKLRSFAALAGSVELFARHNRELLCISFSSGLLLLSNRSCCREWRTSLVAFLVIFQLSFAFIFGL
jgi:hypothetical protein